MTLLHLNNINIHIIKVILMCLFF